MHHVIKKIVQEFVLQEAEIIEGSKFFKQISNSDETSLFCKKKIKGEHLYEKQ